MNWMQRAWFERRAREWAARRGLGGDETLAALNGLSEAEREALLRVLQRVIDGRVAILARSPDLPEAALREARGAIMGLQDLADGLRSIWQA